MVSLHLAVVVNHLHVEVVERRCLLLPHARRVVRKSNIDSVMEMLHHWTATAEIADVLEILRSVCWPWCPPPFAKKKM